MNLCALWELPVLWICENNRYGMGTALEFSESETNIAKKAASYKIESASVDGMDILAVMELAERYADDVRCGKGPRFIEANTYRFRAHSMFDAELYREKSEVDEWKHKDPIDIFYNYLKENDLATDEDVAGDRSRSRSRDRGSRRVCRERHLGIARRADPIRLL